MAEEAAVPFTLIVGRVGVPGAALSTFKGVSDSTGAVRGSVEITQAIPGPCGHVKIPDVTGRRETNGKTTTVTLHATYDDPGKPGKKVKFEEKATCEGSKGIGSFQYVCDGKHHDLTDQPAELA